ncbi:NAD(P)/FAD-dependent oxidoreductase [Archangium violaceum]|uniref:flavin-containing monooxygenase n=1 Tax=Archangium violaceum TaxID=83451 RepID=UPI00193C2495|nr:NAD(P)/FAD-dependent oxidoreductase [Archangium violaceum]QRK08418.1 NAD(P)/FAD-dependent oxidoreductase [Archangium violaceum]
MAYRTELVEQASGGSAARTETPAAHYDVIIVGAGLSGIGAAYHLQANCPTRTYAILEGRDAIGGTWDLFRYPGIRSDSDMHTLGYSFRPWTEAKAIADGPSILRYVRETAREYGIDPHIRFGHHVKKASWSSAEARWTVEALRGPDKEPVRITCNFLLMCSGYYNYAKGHRPEFPGEARFQGTLVHPQFWPEDLDYENKRVVVIGSGATAVTLVPEMARKAAHVTMLQRSPTYVVSRPAEDRIANALRRILPAKLAYGITRWKNVLLGQLFYKLARKMPERVKKLLISQVREHLGHDYDVGTHFTPRYNPWDQRVCLVPDADMFDALKRGRASVVTDQIETFTEKGLALRSGQQLEADIVVTATGLELQLLSDVEFSIDGERRDLSKCLSYKAMMFSDVPNLAYTFGYTNASWTLKADLTSEYVCRLLNHMERYGATTCMPRRDPSVEERPFLDFSAGYVQRALDLMPKQGSKRPWRLYQNYLLDLFTLRFGRVDDGTMEFSRAPKLLTAGAEAPQPEAMRTREAV